MNSRILALLLFLCLTAQASAQETACDCAANLDETIRKTALNYAGFPSKVNTKTKASYALLVSSLRSKSRRQQSAKACFDLIKQYVRFFKDKHFSLTYYPEETTEREIIQVDSIIHTLESGKSDAVEGIWVNPDSSLKLAIKKFPNREYKAMVIASTDKKQVKGQVYFSLTPHQKGFLLNQYNVFGSTDLYARQRGGLLQLWGFALFGKISGKGMTTDEQKELNTWKNNNNGLDFKLLDQETSYLKIPTFFNNDNKIEKLVAASDKTIRATKYLIIDLRGNGGGNAGWSFLLPYIMTGPIQQNGSKLRISEDNVKLKREELESFVKNPVPKEMQKYFPDSYVNKLKRVYNALAVTNAAFIEIPGVAIPLDSVLGKPQKVALITDGLCGSSTEFFFNLMQQSGKTTRYGSNTVGMMDFEGPTSRTPLPCKQLVLMIPVSKMSWADTHPIDQTGFAPDVKLDLPQKDWVNYVRQDLKKEAR
ncbi:S41 family peptidase [Pedobacter sp. W3I1]|uniref:S41 family peptidase n=1 Tax=Pedobacter sp. W3I1 TaxID=3042291 RepID=UPI0027D92E09|nr:S41 family peptidase [Pedobacter sp. W3I1]